jgi:hypothetical protein
MQTCLFLNGHGNGRRTHMSVFFVLMRGPYDPILNFPFKYKVTFCLHDLATKQEHIIDSFDPNIQSNSFQRPEAETNVPIGLPKFCPLSLIEVDGNPYIEDDTMFITVIVDFADLPMSLSKFDAQLNPGLPVHVRQMMVEEEMKRRTGEPQTSPTDVDIQTAVSCEVTDVGDN